VTGISVEMQGLSELMAQLQRIEDIGDQVVLETITDLVTDTHQFAVDGIAGPPATGTVYEKYNPKRTHQASAPGQYPATDTGRLLVGVRMELPSPSKMVGRVGTAVKYGPYLEFGTSKMAARPWLLPSFEKAKIGIAKELKKRLERRI
jgi:hypothetical protein